MPSERMQFRILYRDFLFRMVDLEVRERELFRLRAEVLDIAVRQQILRLMVKEILVGSDTITLRHSIPIPQSGKRPCKRRLAPSGSRCASSMPTAN